MPLFQNEPTSKTFHVKMSLICMKIFETLPISTFIGILFLCLQALLLVIRLTFCLFLQTCLILLEENISEQANTQFKDRNDMTCSDGFIQLSTKQPYLEGMILAINNIHPVTIQYNVPVRVTCILLVNVWTFYSVRTPTKTL